MCHHNVKKVRSRIDPCLKQFIEHLNIAMYKLKTVACCCGHGRYPMTIIVKDQYNAIFDLVSGQAIFRKKRFYKRDKKGYYYIPEVSEEKK